ncbi:50S ribosomal protein L9 [Thermaurantiacus tibetensis]|uniref:50S ribosomal protein L9 n=1 Tax=Thermaurantiacus tibetensis TaxID=2759035 RepID=UPI00188FA429|nr:50S ribosomal protein L9 [Thermaurantiacus tibetensis]
MEVILLERVEKLGRIGDVVKVKPGYARNFLLPRGKALRATEANRAKFEAERAQLEAENARRRAVAEEEAKVIDGLSLVLIRQASNTGALYGSVAARDLAEALAEAGHKVARQAIVLDRPIKTLGLHAVKVVLHPEVAVMVTANVARSAEEAELQAQGVDVTALDRAAEEEAEAPAEAAPDATPEA